MDLNNKYGNKEVFEFELYQYGSLIAKLNTLKESDFIMTRGGRVFLKIKDALIDKNMIDHINKNRTLNFEIKGKSEVRNAETGKDVKVQVYIKRAELIYFKLPSKIGEVSEVTMTFEVFDSMDINTDTKKVR